MKQGLWRAVRGMAPIALATLGLSGCAGFFVKPGSTSGSTTNGTTGTYAYVSNLSTSNTQLGVYNLSSGSLAPVTGSPFTLNFVPAAMAMMPGNTFLYIASTAGAIYAYNIASTGIPSIANSGNAVVALSVAAMDISADGKYLVTLNNDGSTITEYSINTSTGALTFANTVTYIKTGVIPSSIKFAPSGAFIAASLGTAGTIIFPYSSGTINPGYTSLTPASMVGDYSAVLDNGNFLYIARTDLAVVYSLTSAGVPTMVGSAAAGTGPHSVVVYNGNDYVANYGSGTISGYSISGAGVLANLTGSPYTAPSSVATLAVDNTGKYLLALGYDGSVGLKMYAFGSGGTLTSTGSTVPTGTVTSVPAAMALTR